MNLNILINKILIYLYIALVVVIQTGLSLKLTILGIFPNFVLIIGLAFLLAGEFKISAIWLLFGSVLLDLLSPARIGWITISTIISVLPLYVIFKSNIRQVPFVVAIASFVFVSLVSEILLCLFLKSNFNWSILYYAGINTFFGCIMLYIFNIKQKSKEFIKL